MASQQTAVSGRFCQPFLEGATCIFGDWETEWNRIRGDRRRAYRSIGRRRGNRRRRFGSRRRARQLTLRGNESRQQKDAAPFGHRCAACCRLGGGACVWVYFVVRGHCFRLCNRRHFGTGTRLTMTFHDGCDCLSNRSIEVHSQLQLFFLLASWLIRGWVNGWLAGRWWRVR